MVLDASVCALMLLMLRLDVPMTLQDEKENADENNSGASE